MTVVFYTSGHGFGHASRDLEVINAIGDLAPQVRIVMRTQVPSWFLDVSRRVPLDVHGVETDPGVAQLGGLALDEDETARRAAAFYAAFPTRVAREAEVLRSLEATIVVGDIPPLAFAAAAAAHVASVALGNFTWDWIYSAYSGFEAGAPGVLPLISDAYAKATFALRLPFHGGFESMTSNIHDLPLVARRSRREGSDTRRRLEVYAGRRVVLVSFGGHRVDLPFGDIARNERFTLIVTDHEVTHHELAHSSVADAHSSVRWFRRDELTARGIRYEDLVAASDVVVAKPGYGIVSECIANGASLLYTARGRFAEQEVFVAEMPHVLRCRYIAQEDLREGRWVNAIDALLEQPVPAGRMATNGAEVAAGIILQEANRAAIPQRNP